MTDTTATPPPAGQPTALPAVNRRAVFLAGVGAAALVPQLLKSEVRAADAPPADAREQLAAQTQRSQRWAGATPDWVKPRPGVDQNVVVVGGGQTGLGIAHGLRRKGIGRVLVIDRANPGEAGIWRNVARMHQLRTPKTLPGPEQGNPDLGFRAWFETLNGPAAFDALDRIPRLAWADYLLWFERTSAADIRYRTRLVDIEPAGDILRLHLETDGAPRIETARKVVLANGYSGAGGPNVPGFVRGLPAQVWSHTDVPFDFDRLAGKTIAVVGAGASAFDAAATALEHGAAEVHVFNRRAYGAHSDVTWNWLYVTPWSARACSVRVCATPPNVDGALKPTSSSSTMTMLGAPAGGFTAAGQSATDFSGARASIFPRNGAGGLGRLSAATALAAGSTANATMRSRAAVRTL